VGTDQAVLCATANGVCEITLNRPEKLNAFDLPMYKELMAHLEQAASDEAVRVVVIRGEGRAFCVGRDFRYSAELQANESADKWRHEYQGMFRWTLLQDKMVIALVQGYALGGGSALAFGADITIAAHDAKFGYPEIKHAIAGKTMLWPWMLGPKKSLEVLLSGGYITAAEGGRFGLVNRTVDAQNLKEEGTRLALEIASAPPGIPELVKRTVQHASRGMIRTAVDNRRYDTDTAYWDAAGVVPSPWMLSAMSARRSALADFLGQGQSDPMTKDM
jgi:enoyl-CoA hydratase/carnithine racemase